MNVRRIINLARKDLLEVKGNRAVWMPMLIVPLFFVVGLPLLFSLITTQVGTSPQDSLEELQSFMVRMPPQMAALLEGRNGAQQMMIYLIGIFMAPMFLIMPLMFSSIVAAESFAGEKERKTLEGLLYTPASDMELFLGKSLAAVTPAVLIAWVGFVVYTVMVNLMTNSAMGGPWFPLPSWYPMVFIVTPAVAFLGTMFTVLISARVKTFMEAYQNGAMLVLLVLGLMAGQMSGVLYLGVEAGLIVGALCWLVDLVLFRVCVRMFKRSRWISAA